MKGIKDSKPFRYLVGYYGVLQSCHLILLSRAGWLLLQGKVMPFPAPPPPGGWPQTSLPFLLGMGITDVFAITLGLVFVYYYLLRDRLQLPLGLISLTAATSSGIVYLIGTLPSGAWEANPVAYAAVLLLFGPILPLFYYLIKGSFGTGHTQ
jgi:hypothetical protein